MPVLRHHDNSGAAGAIGRFAGTVAGTSTAPMTFF
jgi:hypothetical protein